MSERTELAVVKEKTIHLNTNWEQEAGSIRELHQNRHTIERKPALKTWKHSLFSFGQKKKRKRKGNVNLACRLHVWGSYSKNTKYRIAILSYTTGSLCRVDDLISEHLAACIYILMSVPLTLVQCLCFKICIFLIHLCQHTNICLLKHF